MMDFFLVIVVENHMESSKEQKVSNMTTLVLIGTFINVTPNNYIA